MTHIFDFLKLVPIKYALQGFFLNVIFVLVFYK